MRILVTRIFGVRMLLSDRTIRWMIEDGEMDVSPLTDESWQPASLDVRLDTRFRVFDSHECAYVDPFIHMPELSRLVDVVTDDCFVLHPGEFVLASTFETVRLGRNVAARLEGKSSLGRLGLLTHATAGFIDPGFEGSITLELSNLSRLLIRLWPGMWIDQLCFFQLTSPVDSSYGELSGSKYQGQAGPQPSQYYLNSPLRVAS